MFRDVIKKHYMGMNQGFRYRGEEPGRLENFSDAVFALAITLLLISTTCLMITLPFRIGRRDEPSKK